MESRYPKRADTGINEFLSAKKSQILELLAHSSGLHITAIAQVLQLEVPVTQLALRPMIGVELETRGSRRATKYYLKGKVP